MPGPCNDKRKRKSQTKKEKKKLKESPASSTLDRSALPPIAVSGSDCPPATAICDKVLPQTPCIYDPGNGPRVKDTRAFLSSYFAQPVLLSDPLCAEFAKEEILQMLRTVLPEEIALILWYNKSRGTGRICPACQRLYCLGDVLQDHHDHQLKPSLSEPGPQLQREQQISGLCSPVCFVLASFDYPTAIQSAWGRMANEMSHEAWDLLNRPGEGKGDIGLGMLLKMTRLDDLGLAQLCFPHAKFRHDTTTETDLSESTTYSHRISSRSIDVRPLGSRNTTVTHIFSPSSH